MFPISIGHIRRPLLREMLFYSPEVTQLWTEGRNLNLANWRSKPMSSPTSHHCSASSTCSPLDQWSGFSCWIIAWVKLWALLNANVRRSNVSFWRCLYPVQRDITIVSAVYGRDPKRKCLKETWKFSSLLGEVQGGQIALLCKAVSAQAGASVSWLCHV